MTTIVTTTARRGRRRSSEMPAQRGEAPRSKIGEPLGSLMPDRSTAAAAARDIVATAPKTCEGCASLQIWPRPQCKGEASPHFRRPRDTYHQRCEAYSFGVPAVTVAEPTPRPATAYKLVVRGRVS